ncbi:MAG: hypothetical protein ACI8R9_002487 [Paraglaciecola sp.]|jgi:hypothetical protein
MNLCFRTVLCLSALFALFACGGGGDDALSRTSTDNSGDSGSATYSIQLALSDDTGIASSQLTPDTPLTLSAAVTDSAGAVVPDRLVTFSFTPVGLATFSNDTGTGSTGATGIASIGLLAAASSGSGQVIATLSTGETASITFTSDGGGDSGSATYSIQLALTNAAGMVSSQLTPATPLTLSAAVADSAGTIVPDQLVTFSFTPVGLATFSNDTGTGSTGTTGIASIGLLAAASSGSGQVIATLSTGETASTTFTSSGSEQTNEFPSSLALFASSVQLASSGTDNIDLIAVVKNAQNVLMEGVEVTFSADADAALQISQGTTVNDGIAKATLSTQNNRQNRTITVTAQTGTLSQTLSIAVVGTQVNIDGPSSIIINDPVPLTINLVDSDGNGIANQQVMLSSQSGVLSNTAPVTSTDGQISVNYTASVAGADIITASALNAQTRFEVTVQEDDFSFTAQPADDIPLGDSVLLSISWLKNNAGNAGDEVTVTSSRGVIVTPVQNTDANGLVSFSISSDNAGIASVSAIGVDSDGNEVSARTQIEFVAIEANSIIVDATPDSIGPTGQTSTISAVVRDLTGNLVKGKLINFLVDDVSGGQISPNQATTDRSGIASTVYTSNALSSFEGVKLYATVADKTEVTDFTLMTVGDKPFDIVFGTGNLIQSPTPSSYTKEFSAFVTDPDSNPVVGAEMTFSAPPVAFDQSGKYRKGAWFWDADSSQWIQIITKICDNEDSNANGILDLGEEDSNENGVLDPDEDINGDGVWDVSEDDNGDGQLTPGNVVAIQSNGITDANGQVQFTLSYPRSFGAWVDVSITASGESQGSESSEQRAHSLGVAGADLTDEGNPPPKSPFGISANCNDNN